MQMLYVCLFLFAHRVFKAAAIRVGLHNREVMAKAADIQEGKGGKGGKGAAILVTIHRNKLEAIQATIHRRNRAVTVLQHHPPLRFLGSHLMSNACLTLWTPIGRAK